MTLCGACGQLELKYEAQYLKTAAPEPARAASLPDTRSQRPAATWSQSSEEEYRERQRRRMERAMLGASAHGRQEAHRREQGGAREEGREPGVEHRRKVVRCCSVRALLLFCACWRWPPRLACKPCARRVASWQMPSRRSRRAASVLPRCASACRVNGGCCCASVH